MKKSPILAALILGVVGAIAAAPAFADSTLYSTLGPGSSYNASGFWGVEGSYYSYHQVVAMPFSLATGATVDDAVLGLSNGVGDNTPLNVYIETDSSGSPGSILASLTQVGTVPSYNSGGGLVDFTCSGIDCDLGSGSYWLVASEPDNNSFDIWYWVYNNAATNVELNFSGSPTGPWVSEAGSPGSPFEIDGNYATVTPEPSGLLLLASGLAGLGLMVRRKLRV